MWYQNSLEPEVAIMLAFYFDDPSLNPMIKLSVNSRTLQNRPVLNSLILYVLLKYLINT